MPYCIVICILPPRQCGPRVGESTRRDRSLGGKRMHTRHLDSRGKWIGTHTSRCHGGYGEDLLSQEG